jgi:hypothetical protein
VQNTFKPGELPLLKLRSRNFEVVFRALGSTLPLLDGEGEVLIWWKPNDFGAVLRCVNLKTNIKVLACKKIGPEAKLNNLLIFSN